MSDPLIPIRRLYAEAPDAPEANEALSPEASAEASALAPVKTALEARPRQRPDASVLDAVVARAAEGAPALAAVRALYGEGDVDALAAEASAEAAALGPVKGALDARPPQRPDASVVDAVVAAAAASPAPSVPPRPVRAEDRAPRPGAARRSRIGAWGTAAFALLLVAGMALWTGRAPLLGPVVQNDGHVVAQGQNPTGTNPEGSSPEASSPSQAPAPDALAEAAPPAAQAPAGGAAASPSAGSPSGASLSAGSPAASGSAAAPDRVTQATPPAQTARPAAPAPSGAPAADLQTLTRLATADLDDEALRLFYLRLDAMQEAGFGWDEPTVLLGADPDPGARSRAHGWIQVRVDR